MMRWQSIRRMVAGSALCALFFGCAGNTVKTLPYQADRTAAKTADAKVDGIRYYEEAPFILVYSDSKGGLHTELLFLPDTTRTKVIDPYAWVANNKTVLTFNHGVLTTSSEVLDDTVVPKAIVEAAKTALIAAADLPKADEANDEVPPPALYRLWVNDDGSAELIGGYGTDPAGHKRQNIHVKVSQPDKADTKPTGGEKPPAPEKKQE
jgi:hypothetical protein